MIKKTLKNLNLKQKKLNFIKNIIDRGDKTSENPVILLDERRKILWTSWINSKKLKNDNFFLEIRNDSSIRVILIFF